MNAMKIQPNLREQKKARTREQIIAAAVELFAQNGYESTTVDEIAAAADVSRRTFFRYFASKELVVFPHENNYFSCFDRILRDVRDGEPAFARVRRACMTLAHSFMQSRDEHLRQQRIIRASPTLVDRGDQFDLKWEKAIAEALVAGTEADQGGRLVARLAAAAIMGLIVATIREWYDDRLPADLVELGNIALDMIECGMSSIPTEIPAGEDETPR